MSTNTVFRNACAGRKGLRSAHRNSNRALRRRRLVEAIGLALGLGYGFPSSADTLSCPIPADSVEVWLTGIAEPNSSSCDIAGMLDLRSGAILSIPAPNTLTNSWFLVTRGFVAPPPPLPTGRGSIVNYGT